MKEVTQTYTLTHSLHSPPKKTLCDGHIQLHALWSTEQLFVFQSISNLWNLRLFLHFEVCLHRTTATPGASILYQSDRWKEQQKKDRWRARKIVSIKVCRSKVSWRGWMRALWWASSRDWAQYKKHSSPPGKASSQNEKHKKKQINKTIQWESKKCRSNQKEGEKEIRTCRDTDDSTQRKNTGNRHGLKNRSTEALVMKGYFSLCV